MNSGAAKEEKQSVRIREERDNLNLIFESMVDGMYLVSKDRKLAFMNRVLREKFGDRVGDICYETFHSRHVPCPLCKLLEVLDGKTVRWEWHSQRTGMIYDLVETPLTNADGTTSKLTIFRDIMNRKRREAERAMEEQLRLQLLDELERSNNELKDFAYIVSHDLKAPLRAITSLAEWLAADYGDKLDEDGREQLELLKNRTRRMHNLIESILTYSRIGRSKEEKEEVDLNTLVSEVIALIDPPEDIEIEVVGELPTIPFERTRMEQIFQNLLGNAALYMDKPEGRITISCTDGGSNWRFAVADNGPGIDEKYYKKIFQIFQTLRPRDEVESTGVGLTIVRKIVRMHGGENGSGIEIGRGEHISLYHPKRGLQRGRWVIKKNLEIMLVEDDTVDVMAVKRALKDINVTNHLIVASDGKEALSYLMDERNKRPGIILLDLNMPGMNGVEFLAAAKKNRVLKSIPVVVLTTSRADKDKVDSFDLGVAGYMVKPVGYVRFVEVMKTINRYWTLSELPEG